MQKTLVFLKQNGLSIFSLLAIIGVIVWVASRPVQPGRPDISPGSVPTASPASKSINDQLVAVAESLDLNTETFTACLTSRKYKGLVETSTEEGRDLGIQGTPSSIINGTLLVGALPLTEFDKQLASGEKGPLQPDIPGFSFLGKESAPHLIVEYGDYRCGYCKKFHDEILTQLQEKYIDTGKARFVFKDMVIFGEESQMIAEAARCAGDQGKFWEYHAKGFSLTSAD
ncbi:MAG: DSBA oxidoreductase [Parcubacteria group bacterium GW2011_GWB1_46_8]|nr:MAG: DSBA oxidoreductase [Parcubacteria group bacterium GW2011_GWF1_45_5]KKU11324.1 MAG: DSBA oxidoreductase [Parcubacteria group bacterium GW2011_GWA1_45_7]KKU43947.1 MAG: DSBA oxidoreductase [Parcubacteria group bacterium GW2011_GWA2_46_7]KKU46245.1 MAG: DSBA oxidoreductase [Parcubacteria group bacterium GW2011_GWB1_46_8]KKU47188.1 MAG: DSBA oxidoreductase [Parcubacteria group bacterium GW2011_GWF2_46_8]